MQLCFDLRPVASGVNLHSATHVAAAAGRREVCEAEAQVPMAMAEAFRAGHLGIMDYYRMKNVQADTSMRESIAGTDKPRTEAS